MIEGKRVIGADFICNICGSSCKFSPHGDWREAPSCHICGSSVRARQIAHCVSLGMLGQSLPLSSVDRSDLRGVGLSDAEMVADALTKAFSYTNSFYHQEPMLDICSPEPHWISSVDFLTSSDVFEHVPNPVSNAFSGAYDVLKNNGLLVLTVPFDDRPETTEHFSGIVEFRTIPFNDEWLLVGKNGDGDFEVHQDLIFHGGPGTTVEMRFFGLRDLLQDLLNAGFAEVHVHTDSVPEYGIFPPHNHGLPITAWKR